MFTNLKANIFTNAINSSLCREQYPKVVEEIEKSLYVDDSISGGPTIQAARQVKETSSDIFAQGGFTLHEWHSNVRELDTVNTQRHTGDLC